MEFTLRGLKSDDMFLMFGILSKIGFKDLKESLNPERVKELTSAFKGGNKEDVSTYVGFNVALDFVELVMKNLPACKTEIYSLLASISGMKVKEISELPMADFTEMIIAVVQKEDFKDFFKAVAKLFH